MRLAFAHRVFLELFPHCSVSDDSSLTDSPPLVPAKGATRTAALRVSRISSFERHTCALQLAAVDHEAQLPSELMRPEFADGLSRSTADLFVETPALAEGRWVGRSNRDTEERRLARGNDSERIARSRGRSFPQPLGAPRSPRSHTAGQMLSVLWPTITIAAERETPVRSKLRTADRRKSWTSRGRFS